MACPNRVEKPDQDQDQDEIGSQVSLISSTQENDACTNRETVNMTNSEMRTGKNRNTGLCNPPADPEADYEKTS